MRLLVGISGGMDSAYVAYKLIEMGHTVEGLVLKMHEFTDLDGAQKAADLLGIRLHILDCTRLFSKYVVSNFVSEYSSGRTPNPCTVCNRYVKIAELCRYAKENGFDKAVTGHYASVAFDEGSQRFYVKKGLDERKDQSYMLWHLTQEQLGILYLPLGDSVKENVREDIKSTPLSYLADAKESQEICFIPDNDYASYIEKQMGKFPEGSFVDAEGKVIGRHKGIIHYTVGQRKGLGISLGAPAYITKIDPLSNTVTVEKMSDVKGDSLIAVNLNGQLIDPKESESYRLNVKIRYAATPVSAEVRIKDNKAYVTFDQPVRAVTPGQSAVFYKDNGIAFGGTII